MDIGTDSINVNTLVNNIMATVDTMVKDHLRTEFERIAKNIGCTYNLNPDEVLSTICTMTAVEKTMENKKKAKNTTPTPSVAVCVMKTKAGTPCKYKRVSGDGETMCKKHKNMLVEQQPIQVAALPTEEQAWFNDKAVYTTSHCPRYDDAPFEMDPDIVDDSQAYVVDE